MIARVIVGSGDSRVTVGVLPRRDTRRKIAQTIKRAIVLASPPYPPALTATLLLASLTVSPSAQATSL